MGRGTLHTVLFVLFLSLAFQGGALEADNIQAANATVICTSGMRAIGRGETAPSESEPVRPATDLGQFKPITEMQAEALPLVQGAYQRFQARAATDAELQRLRKLLDIEEASLEIATTNDADRKARHDIARRKFEIESREQQIFREELQNDVTVPALQTRLAALDAELAKNLSQDERARLQADRDKVYKALVEHEFMIVDTPAFWNLKDKDGKNVPLPVHLAQAFTFDHHGPFLRADRRMPSNNEKRNSTKQVVEHIQSIMKDRSLTPEQRAQKLRDLEGVTLSTDNLGDGVLAMWAVRNARRIAADPKLQRAMMAATFYEDYGLFGTKFDELMVRPEELPALARKAGESDADYAARDRARHQQAAQAREDLMLGREIAQSLLQNYDGIVREARDRVVAANPPKDSPAWQVGYSDRFSMLSPDEQRAMIAQGMQAVDRAFSTDPADIARRKKDASDFVAAVSRAMDAVPQAHQKARDMLIDNLAETVEGDDATRAEARGFFTSLVDEFEKEVFITTTLDPTAPGMGRFSTWAALPRSHDKTTQIELNPMGTRTGFVQAHPQGRPMTARMAPAVNRIRELHAERVEMKAVTARGVAETAARSQGMSEEQITAAGEAAYQKERAGLGFAVMGRPGDSDFNFSFTGVNLAPGEVLRIMTDQMLAEWGARQRATQLQGPPTPGSMPRRSN